MTRSEQRQQIVKLIYEKTFHEESMDEIIALAVAEREIKVNDFIRRAAAGVFEHLDEIDGLITSRSIGWKLKRIPKLPLDIMRLCVYEMLYEKDIPVAASINEAVELAKLYGDDDAPSFVNGVLGSVAEDISEKETEQ